MGYPDLPKNRLIVDGVDLTMTYGMVLLDGYTLDPPEPKTYTIDIPGGNGIIDLTEALTGDVVYNNRTQEFTFALIHPENFEEVKSKVFNFLHGQSFDYRLTMDEEYFYHGRFTVSTCEHEADSGGIVGQITISIDADPYKSKGTQTYKLNATGGKLYRFESGRCKVRPVIECSQVCFVRALPDGNETIIPAGTFRLNDVLFTQGFNELWINTQKFWDITWDEIKEGGQFAKTWADLAGLRWDEVQMLGQDTETVLRSWYDIGDNRWEDLGETGSNPKHWYDLNYTKNEIGDSYAYLSYEWKDL